MIKRGTLNAHNRHARVGCEVRRDFGIRRFDRKAFPGARNDTAEMPFISGIKKRHKFAQIQFYNSGERARWKPDFLPQQRSSLGATQAEHPHGPVVCIERELLTDLRWGIDDFARKDPR